jgi:hypothetical protein
MIYSGHTMKHGSYLLQRRNLLHGENKNMRSNIWRRKTQIQNT